MSSLQDVFFFSSSFAIELWSEVKDFIKQQTGNQWNIHRNNLFWFLKKFSASVLQSTCKVMSVISRAAAAFLICKKCNLQSFLKNTTGCLINYSSRLSIFPLQIYIHMATKLPCYQDTALSFIVHVVYHLDLKSNLNLQISHHWNSMFVHVYKCLWTHPSRTVSFGAVPQPKKLSLH